MIRPARFGTFDRMKRIAIGVALGVMVGGLGTARGDASVTVTLTQAGQAYAASHGLSTQQLQDELTKDVNDAYQTANVGGFLRAFTDATAFSQRGLGVDYASAPQSYLVGIAGNVAAASDSVLTKQDRPTAGAAVNFAAMAGANLHELGLPRWTVFASGFYQNGSTGASTNELEGSITSAGAHVQYRLIEPEANGGTANVVRWLGLDITTGLEFTRWRLGGRNFKNTFTLDTGDKVDLAATGNFDLTSNAVTIPVEATTGLRIALIASVFAGVGIDLTAGKSDVAGSLSGDVQQAGSTIGNVTLTATGNNTGSPAAVRALAGVQINLWKLKVFVQANVSQTPAASVAFGVRLVL